ncbi:MAG: transcriptional regulator [bacterium]|nr:transcriptional regulator [bacterium]
MNIRPIKTDEDYQSALAEIERLMDAPLNSPMGDRLDVLTTLVEAYEEKNFTIEEPDPVEAILHRMDALGLSWEDMQNLIGAEIRIADVLTRREPLTIPVIRKIHQELNVPAEILIQPYHLESSGI